MGRESWLEQNSGPIRGKRSTALGRFSFGGDYQGKNEDWKAVYQDRHEFIRTEIQENNWRCSPPLQSLETMVVGLHREQTMKRPPFQHTIEGRVLIKAPVEKVYKFYRNFNNLPSFLGDVVAIDQTNGPSSRWTIQGPLGIHVHWTVRVTEDRANQLIKYETTGRPGPQTYWEIYFLPGSTARDTEVHEVMRTTLGTIGRAALALMGKFPGQEVAANLRRLKELMETGRVSDTSYAAKRKFGQRARNGNHRQDTLTNRVDWQRANEN